MKGKTEKQNRKRKAGQRRRKAMPTGKCGQAFHCIVNYNQSHNNMSIYPLSCMFTHLASSLLQQHREPHHHECPTIYKRGTQKIANGLHESMRSNKRGIFEWKLSKTFLGQFCFLEFLVMFQHQKSAARRRGTRSNRKARIAKAFDELQALLPSYPLGRKLTKCETLRLAAIYIQDLTSIVRDSDVERSADVYEPRRMRSASSSVAPKTSSLCRDEETLAAPTTSTSTSTCSHSAATGTSPQQDTSACRDRVRQVGPSQWSVLQDQSPAPGKPITNSKHFQSRRVSGSAPQRLKTCASPLTSSSARLGHPAPATNTVSSSRTAPPGLSPDPPFPHQPDFLLDNTNQQFMEQNLSFAGDLFSFFN